MGKRFLIVGAGLYGSVCARELTDAGHRCVVLEKRDHIGGNCFTRYSEEADCHQHVYGAHVFHTDNEAVWEYMNRFARFNNYVNRVKVRYKDRVFSFPINLMTFHQLYGVTTPQEAEAKLQTLRVSSGDPHNLEDWCLSQVGPEIYEIFIRGYTWKQWGRSPRDLPASIIQRLPIRLTFDDNYYTHPFQGIPVGGYTGIFERLLDGIPVELDCDFLKRRDAYLAKFDHVVYTGPIDAFFDYAEGVLPYRSLRFETELLDVRDFQGNAVINHAEMEVPYTRVIEHKHFDLAFGAGRTLITREYPESWEPGKDAYYPVHTEAGGLSLARYRRLAQRLAETTTFGGRLGEYRYWDMDQVVAAALRQVRQMVGRMG